MIIIVYSLLSVVVTMLVTGSLHMLNKRFIHFDKIDIVTIIIAVMIIFMTVIYFLKNAKRIYRFIEEQVTHRA